MRYNILISFGLKTAEIGRDLEGRLGDILPGFSLQILAECSKRLSGSSWAAFLVFILDPVRGSAKINVL